MIHIIWCPPTSSYESREKARLAVQDWVRQLSCELEEARENLTGDRQKAPLLLSHWSGIIQKETLDPWSLFHSPKFSCSRITFGIPDRIQDHILGSTAPTAPSAVEPPAQDAVCRTCQGNWATQIETCASTLVAPQDDRWPCPENGGCPNFCGNFYGRTEDQPSNFGIFHFQTDPAHIVVLSWRQWVAETQVVATGDFLMALSRMEGRLRLVNSGAEPSLNESLILLYQGRDGFREVTLS